MLTVFVVVYATTKLALPRTLLLDAISLGRRDRGRDHPAVRLPDATGSAAGRSTLPA